MTGENSLLMRNAANVIIPAMGVYSRTLVETHDLLKNLKNHQQVLNMCTQGGHNLFFLFSRLMESVSTECTQNFSVLENIKSELEITLSNSRFDVVSVFEMLENSKKLLKYSRIIEQQNKLIQKSIANFIEIITTEKYKIEHNTFNRLASMISKISLPAFGLATVASVATVSAVMESGMDRFTSEKKTLAISAVLGAFSVAGAAIDVIGYCKDDKVDATLDILNRLHTKLGAIQSSSDQFALLINTLVDTFINYVSSADKSTAYVYHTGTRPTVLATKMMKETAELQKHLKLIKAKADEYASQILLLEHCESVELKKRKLKNSKSSKK